MRVPWSAAPKCPSARAHRQPLLTRTPLPHCAATAAAWRAAFHGAGRRSRDPRVLPQAGLSAALPGAQATERDRALPKRLPVSVSRVMRDAYAALRSQLPRSGFCNRSRNSTPSILMIEKPERRDPGTSPVLQLTIPSLRSGCHSCTRTRYADKHAIFDIMKVLLLGAGASRGTFRFDRTPIPVSAEFGEVLTTIEPEWFKKYPDLPKVVAHLGLNPFSWSLEDVWGCVDYYSKFHFQPDRDLSVLREPPVWERPGDVKKALLDVFGERCDIAAEQLPVDQASRLVRCLPTFSLKTCSSPSTTTRSQNGLPESRPRPSFRRKYELECKTRPVVREAARLVLVACVR